MTFKKLTVQFTAFILLLIPATLLINFLFPAITISEEWPGILLFMYIVSIIVLYLLSKAMKERMAKFVNMYLLVSFSKMMLYVIVLFVYAWLNPESAVPFILTFLIYYLFLLIYEVFVLLRFKEEKQ